MRSLPYPAYLLTRGSEIAEVSYAFADLTGYGKEFLLQKTLPELCALLFKGEADRQNLFHAGEEAEFFLFTRTNHIRLVTVRTCRGVFQGESYVIFIEKSGSRIEDRFPYLEQLFQANQTGIAVYGMPGSILLKANQRYLDSLDEPGSCPEYSVGRPIHEIIMGWSGSLWEAIWKQAIESAQTVSGKDLEFCGFKRGVTYWDTVVTPIKQNGTLRYMIENAAEVTERIVNRQSIEESAAAATRKKEEIENILKVKDDFFSFISHEFKTPLTVISAAIQAMEHICADDMSEKAKKFTMQIKQNSLRLLRLVNNLLDITRMENGYMKIHRRNIDIVYITRMITESVMVYAKEKGVELSFESALSHEVIALDDEKYERILLNLLSNAIKFTPAGNKVTVRLASKHGIVCLEVMDQGIGIPEEDQKRVFERFTQVDSSLTRSKEGTGIGLFLTRLLVEALDGEIVLDSKVGQGSTFTVLLPAIKAAEGVAEGQAGYSEDHRSQQAAAIEFSDI